MRHAATLFAMIALLLNVAVAAEVRHSGAVTQVTPNQITIDEMGPWTGAANPLTPRTIEIDEATTVTRAERADEPDPAGWPGGFKESPLRAHEIRVGDFVTVTTIERDGREIAQSIVVVRPTEAPSASPR